MGCFNDPAWTTTTRRVCGWWGGGVVGWWCGRVADTNYLYPARWGWINNCFRPLMMINLVVMMRWSNWTSLVPARRMEWYWSRWGFKFDNIFYHYIRRPCMLIKIMVVKRGKLTSPVLTKRLASSRLYLWSRSFRLIIWTLLFQACGDDQPCDTEDITGPANLCQRGCHDQGNTLDLIIYCNIIDYFKGYWSDKPDGGKERETDQSTSNQKSGMIKVILLILIW